MTEYGIYTGNPSGSGYDWLEFGFPERVVSANLDVLLTAPVLSLLNVSIADEYTRDVNLQVFVKAIWNRVADLNFHIFGEIAKTLDLNVLIQGQDSVSTDLDISIEAFERKLASLNMMIAAAMPYNYMRLRKDLLTRYFGGFASDSALYPPSSTPPTITEGIGRFGLDYRSEVYITPNTIPTPSTFDKCSWLLSGPLSISTVGFRSITKFHLTQIGPNSLLVFGLCGDQLDPESNISSGDVCFFGFEAEEDHVWFRGWYGTSVSPTNIGSALPISYFLNRSLMVEMELIDVGVTNTMEFRLFVCDVDLDVPLASFQLQSSVAPTVDRYSVTSLGRRSPDLPTSQPDMLANFDYLDVEPGTGVLYSIDPAVGLPISEAKWRLYQDRPPIQLRAFGLNRIIGALSADAINATTEVEDTITVDAARPTIHVTSLVMDSPAFVPYAVTPPIPKGSAQPGFSGVALTWFATQPGTWTLRVNSTYPGNGIELQGGQYTTPGISVTTNWDFADLPGPDGIYDVTLYLINAAGLATAKGIGEYILPFKPKLGAALDVSLSPMYHLYTDMNITIQEVGIERLTSLSPNVSLSYPYIQNPEFTDWASSTYPLYWLRLGVVSGKREITRVGPTEGHGGTGLGACNIWHSAIDPGITVSCYQNAIGGYTQTGQPADILMPGRQYRVTVAITYAGIGTLEIDDSQYSQFGPVSYTTIGVKEILFVATQDRCGIRALLRNEGDFTIDYIHIEEVYPP